MVSPGEPDQFPMGHHHLPSQAAGAQLLLRNEVVEGSGADGKLAGGLFAVIQEAGCVVLLFCAHEGQYPTNPPFPDYRFEKVPA